jgi:hypothetical protein
MSETPDTPSTEALTPDEEGIWRSWGHYTDAEVERIWATLDAERAVRQQAADTSGPIIRAIQSDWRLQNLPDVPPDDATIARLRSIATGEAADTSGLREDVDLWRIADNGSEWTRAWNRAIECIQREAAALRGATERPPDGPA